MDYCVFCSFSRRLLLNSLIIAGYFFAVSFPSSTILVSLLLAIFLHFDLLVLVILKIFFGVFFGSPRSFWPRRRQPECTMAGAHHTHYSKSSFCSSSVSLLQVSTLQCIRIFASRYILTGGKYRSRITRLAFLLPETFSRFWVFKVESMFGVRSIPGKKSILTSPATEKKVLFKS